MPNIALTDITLSYGDTQALCGLTLTVAAGEPLTIIGPSGCGKSSLLTLIAGLKTPDAGRLLIDDQPLTAPRRQTAYIPQGYDLLPWKTVLENAALGLIISGTPKIVAYKQALAALKNLGIANFAQSWPHELSGGMRQRAALARALVIDADILLADEPLSALDALTREELQNTLLDLWRERGYTQILVTHSVEEAVLLGRRIVLLGARPATVRAVIDNPQMGDTGYRNTPTFFEMCTRLRECLTKECAQ